MAKTNKTDTHFHVWAAPDDGGSFTRTLHMDAQPHFSRGGARKAAAHFPLHTTILECINDKEACLRRWDRTAKRRGWLQCEACGRWSEDETALARHARLHCSAR